MTQGSIYFVERFEYEDGGESTDKLLIVLYIDNVKSIVIRALPTSQQKIPNSILNNGCTNNDMFSFFMFGMGIVVGVKNDGSPFSFEKNTFVFVRDNVNTMSISDLTKYQGGRIRLIVNLNPDKFERLIKCVKKSKHLKNRVKKAFEDHNLNTK